MNLLNNYLGFENKTYLVTGASSGIGKNVAILLDKLGANLILNGRNEEHLQETYNQLQNKKNHILAIADLTQTDCNDFIKKYQTPEKPIAGVAHCAGEYAFTPLRAYDPNQLLTMLNNYTVTMCNLFIACCKNKKSSTLSLVTMSSVSTKLGVVGNAFYGASRAASESLCRNIAIEFASRNIRCNVVVGGHMINSKMGDGYLQQINDHSNLENRYPLKFGDTIDAANAIIFLLSDNSKWITGQQIIVDGGVSVKGV